MPINFQKFIKKKSVYFFYVEDRKRAREQESKIEDREYRIEKIENIEEIRGRTHSVRPLSVFTLIHIFYLYYTKIN